MNMAWFRVPRSLRTYIILGLVITIAIITFSTSKILRIGASDPNSPFQLLVASQNKQQGFLEGSPGSELAASVSSASQPSLFSTISSQRRTINSSTLNNPNADFHTTSVNQPTVSIHSQSVYSPETNSDIIIISPSSTSASADTLNKFAGYGSDQVKAASVFDGSTQPNAGVSSDQALTSLNTTTSSRSMREFSLENVEHNEYRRNTIREMMKHAWAGYAKYAWGYSEVRPVSKAPHTESIFGGEKLGASIVDGIDTLWIMGLQDEYLAARTWIENNLNFDNFEADLSVFETNIRYVGGLLSIYALTKDRMFLDKATQIADKLLPAFNTTSGIPYSNVNLRSGFARNHDWAFGAAILSEFGSMHLEFIYLSEVTGNPVYREKAYKVRAAIKRAVPREDGLYNNYINTETGQWLTRPTHISMGALGDSFYEYLIKAYVQSNGRDLEAYQMYIRAIKAFENKLIFTSTQSRLVYFAELKDTQINHKMDSLACFSGGMLAMGASKSADPTIRNRHMTLASGIANTCHESCIRTKSHLGPETFVFSNLADAIAYGPAERYYILRPEILETYFYMWRYTHDPKYRAWAWDFVEALETYCKSEAGYSGLRNVNQPVIKDDVQQTFFLAEVLKYLYLIFSDDNVISLDEWVFNTEAHPFPILRRS